MADVTRRSRITKQQNTGLGALQTMGSGFTIFLRPPATASVGDIVVCVTDHSWKGLMTMEHDVPTGLLDIANVQVNRVVEELRRIAASGRLITIEDITMLLLGAELKNIDRQRELLAVLLAVTLQRLAWQ
jgi:hypothetical protein